MGIDAVAMCVNDILCHGAKPLFFLDYLACGKLNAEVAAEIVSGIAQGCLEAKVSLIGGETAEMPGFYKIGDYDIAGFCVGVVEKDKIVNGSKVKHGDIIIGLASSGFHSNGYSLIRKIFSDYDEEILGKKIDEILLTPTRIYVENVLKILDKFNVNGMAHITGGGLIENLPRAMGENMSPVVFKNNLIVPDIFKELQRRGDISEEEMFGTFNMGVGFTLIVDSKDVDNILEELNNLGEKAFIIGHVEKGDNTLCLK